jgi:hypothetical protein
MNKVLIALLASLTVFGAYAADDSTKSRADVKAEARATNKMGAVGHGESDGIAAKAQAKLSKEEMTALRAMIKDEARAANKKGEASRGEGNEMAVKAEAKLSKEEMTALRAMVK